MSRPRAFTVAVLFAQSLALGAAATVAQSPPSAPAGSSATASSGSGGGLGQSPGAVPSFGPVTLRTVEIPGTRLISMSPDGRWIVGAVPITGFYRGRLCVYEVETLAQRSCADLSGLGAGVRLADVTWSPDSRHLAFSEEAFKFLKDGDLWLMDAETGALTNLDDDHYQGAWAFKTIPGTITEPVSPTFTIDGQTVTYSRTTIIDGELAGNDIAEVAITGGTPTRLVEVPEQQPGVLYFGKRWAPDGSRLYYSYAFSDPTDPNNGIWVVAADGRGASQLVGASPELGSAPAVAAISANGDQLLAWYPIRASQATVDGGPVLALIDTSTGSSRLLRSTSSDAAPHAYVQMAAFSPDGSALLTVTDQTTPDHQVLIGAATGDSSVPVVSQGLPFAGPPDQGVMPTWASNGTVFIPGGPGLDTGTILTLPGSSVTSIALPSPSPAA